MLVFSQSVSCFAANYFNMSGPTILSYTLSGVTYTVTAKATATANVSSYYLGIDMYSYYHTSTGKVCR